MRSDNIRDYIGQSDLDLLRAIRAGRVVRDDDNGTRKGAFKLYMLDGVEVGMKVRRLRKLCLANVPLLGPPTITEDGAKLLE